MKEKPILEVCCGDVDSALAAVEGGADRIELCAALSEGGITPPFGSQIIAWGFDKPVNVLIRSRRGDFCYSHLELEEMENDILHAKEHELHGVVIGALTPEGDIDVKAVKNFMRFARGMETTFHRAFDMCRDPQTALETLIDLGVDNVLTSGLRPTALEGVDNLRRLVEQADGRINIIAGCGVTPENVEQIIRATGVQAVHSTCSMTVESRMVYRRADVHMGNPEDEYMYKTTDINKVRAMRRIIDNIRL